MLAIMDGHVDRASTTRTTCDWKTWYELVESIGEEEAREYWEHELQNHPGHFYVDKEGQRRVKVRT